MESKRPENPWILRSTASTDSHSRRSLALAPRMLVQFAFLVARCARSSKCDSFGGTRGFFYPFAPQLAHATPGNLLSFLGTSLSLAEMRKGRVILAYFLMSEVCGAPALTHQLSLSSRIGTRNPIDVQRMTFCTTDGNATNLKTLK